MKDQPKKQKEASTREIVDILDIRDSVVILKNGSLRSVIEVGSMNFSLKSTDEQKAIIVGFQDFLNSLDFTLQIVVSSRGLNITNYLKSVEAAVSGVENDLLKIQGTEYARFVGGLAQLANVVAKHFYMVVPFYIAESTLDDTGAGLMDKLRGLVKPAAITKNISDETLDKYRGQLQQRVDVVAAGVSRLGLTTRMLGYDELLNMYYQYYNPSEAYAQQEQTQ